MGSDKEMSVAGLKTAIENYNRKLVKELLKQDVLSQVSETEKASIYLGIISLRDMELVDFLAKKLSVFTPEMIRLDFENWNNREFVHAILKKYRKKFDFTDETVCEGVMEIACEVNEKSTAVYLIKQQKATAIYPKLAGAADELFYLLLQADTAKLDADMKLQILYEAAKSAKAENRLTELAAAGYDLKMKNKTGQTLADLLKEDISSGKYAKNKRGELARTRDKAVLQYLEKTLNHPQEVKPKKFTKKQILVFGVVAVVILGVIAYVIGRSVADNAVSELEEDANTVTAESVETGTETAAELGYSTDQDRTVADGDTVNIDYVGYVDGVEFSGGNTQGMGTDLTIGSNYYIDDFEEQLIGYKAGDEVIVRVTFPENYGREELNGKEAEFHVTINGIYE